MADDERIVAARAALGHELACLRKGAGISQNRLAPLTAYSRSTLAGVETGRGNVQRDFWERCDAALNTDGRLARMYDDIMAMRRSNDEKAAQAARDDRTAKLRAVLSESTLSEYGDTSTEQPSTSLLESAIAIRHRMAWMSSPNVDDARLDYLEHALVTAIADSERTPPGQLAPQAYSLRLWVDERLRGHQHPRQRARLYSAATVLSGLLSVLSIDLGQLDTARAYAAEAFDLATFVEDGELQAWSRAAQSLVEYYGANYHDALALARDGQRYAVGGGKQAIRLMLNGEARALARLGDGRGVDDAVGRGFELLHAAAPRTDVGTGMDLEPYSLSRAAANAATAYLLIGRPDEVGHYTGQALDLFDTAGLTGPRALTRLDHATALLMGDNPDPARAATIARAAVVLNIEVGLGSVKQRSAEFVAAAAPWSAEPEVREVAEMVRAQRAQRALPPAG